MGVSIASLMAAPVAGRPAVDGQGGNGPNWRAIGWGVGAAAVAAGLLFLTPLGKILLGLPYWRISSLFKHRPPPPSGPAKTLTAEAAAPRRTTLRLGSPSAAPQPRLVETLPDDDHIRVAPHLGGTGEGARIRGGRHRRGIVTVMVEGGRSIVPPVPAAPAPPRHPLIGEGGKILGTWDISLRGSSVTLSRPFERRLVPLSEAGIDPQDLGLLSKCKVMKLNIPDVGGNTFFALSSDGIAEAIAHLKMYLTGERPHVKKAVEDLTWFAEMAFRATP